ncbi:MBL fold metallo-hydrolase [Tamaricihabitans halophyticus]|nr:MBL fold metallo-hydrolase [Tamaricihabitans halophyticus]
MLRFAGHATVSFRLGGKTVLTDPVLTSRVGPLARVRAPLDPAEWTGADLVVISHQHLDHLHLPSLRLLGRRTPIVVPHGVGPWLRQRGFTEVHELDVGEQLVDGGLRVTATSARHSGHRWGPRLRHGPQAPALGYLLEGDGLRAYFAGDTDLFAGMAELAPVDLALLPVWGWGLDLGPGHLDPGRAARAVGLLRARLAVPVHWGTLAMAGLTRGKGRLAERMRRLLVEPPHLFARAVAAAGHDTVVPVLRPGSALTHDFRKTRTAQQTERRAVD